MSKKCRVLTFIAALTLYALTMPISAFAATTISVSSGAEFSQAAQTVRTAADNEYIIELTKNIETGEVVFSSSYPVSVSIVGNGHTVKVNPNSRIAVNRNVQLNLGAADPDRKYTLIISGGNVQCGDGPGMLYIEGTCNMYSGVTIADRIGNNYFGGGVTVRGGTFHMFGGTIDHCGITGGSVCYGGGVAVIYGGSFIMDGGVIKNCFVTSPYKDDSIYPIITSVGGGVFVSGGSSFVMNDGAISNNKANEMGGGVAVVASLKEIQKGGWGNLESSAQILGGTISYNEANDGAGVLASAYFYTDARGLCAPTPGVGAAEKPGLFLNNTTITNNTANQDEGYGGGVLVVRMKSPAAAEISDCSITKNSAAKGGGVASYLYDTSLTVDGCTITGNMASNYGGGFAAESNSREGAGTTIYNTKLCNNSADMAGSDVYLSSSVAKLSAAKDMNELYLGKPDDVTNKKIDGWYLDNKDARYTTQTKEQRSEYSDYASIGSDGEVCLVAAANPSLVKITFANEDGTFIYSEDLYEIGTKADKITVPTPTKPSDDKYDYVFDSWDKEITDATEDVVYKAQFKKVPKNNPGNPNAGKPDAAPGNNTPGAGGSQTNGSNANADSAIPPMGDHTATVLGAALTGTGVLALAAAICARKRKRI
ncbi:MAG: hypothetical protein SPG58_00565 [Collinsella sp.]|nr:hypothetical protein [Collinsella sp.]